MYESLLNYPNSLFGEFERLRRELDDAFGVSGMPGSIRSVAAGSAPAINIGRTPTSVEVYAFAPGLDATKIDVTLDRGVLRLGGERASALPQGERAKGSVYARERSEGRFSRTVALPDDVDPAHVKATYTDGVLQISIARREAVQPKRITVQ